MWLFAVAITILVGAEKQPITTTDLLKIRKVTEVKIASDGSFAVYGVQSIHQEKEEYSYRTNLWYIDLNDPRAKPRQLTFGARSDSGMAISPDGKLLAFVRADDKRVGQVWMLPLDGSGEARMVTHLEHGAANPVWHPRKRQFLVTSNVPLSKIEEKPHFDQERPRRDWLDADSKANGNPDGDRKAIRNWLEKNSAKGNPVTINRLAFQGEMALENEIRIGHLYNVDLDQDGKASQLTKGSQGFGRCAYSPSGDSLACSGSPAGSQHPDRDRRSAIWILGADGSSPRALLDSPTESYASATFYADGKSLLVTAQQQDEPMFRQSRLGKYELSSNRMEWISGSWSGDTQSAQVASDGSILFSSPWHGGEPLLRLDGKKLQRLVEGPVGVSAFDEGGGRTVYALISVPNPNELYVREKNGKTRQLTEMNSGWLAGKILSIPQEKWITRPDGVKVQTWVLNPVRAENGKKYPWVLDIHGGPTAMWGPGELSMWHEFQLFCAWGYGVVYSNPRGSGGYGYEFQKGNYRNWGEGPAGDVLAALDEAVKTNAYSDKDRLFITGGSYAGYLTAWIIAHDHRFKAAAAQRGVYDLSTFYGEGNAFRLVKNAFGGRPYESGMRPLLEEQSPFTHVAKIRTPLLILHGSLDLRTGVSQSEMLYRALKDLGREVEYVRYPGVGHELTRSGAPLQRMDHMLRIIEFFERYAGNDSPAPVSQ
ncbi:MAG: S9 family peptidase [Acidobacteria bacterium]|nr:S9 family peptidase [Acidobacteriota bacterium]